MITPATIDELAEAVRDTPRLLAVGNRTKPSMSAVDAELVSTTKLSGIIEYEPSEFTFTALAGTPVSEIVATLSAQGQYLPFDPVLVNAGATLGGTVAAGLSGPGRFRYGGVRDFILGVRFVDGMGRVLRMGGKVVKNAAGFDLPKFFVGSLGRFGVLAELTFKVFPRAATRTLRIETDSIEAAIKVVTDAARTRWECDALDILTDGKTVLIRLAGPEALANEVLSRWPGTIVQHEVWNDITEFNWAGESLVKLPTTPVNVPRLYQAGRKVHISGGGNVAYISGANDIESAFAIRGPSAPTTTQRPQIWEAVKHALDPQNRFPD